MKLILNEFFLFKPIYKNSSRIFFWISILFTQLSCGIKGNPQPPDIPPFIGHGLGVHSNIDSNQIESDKKEVFENRIQSNETDQNESKNSENKKNKKNGAKE